jgi:hypothetical protein
MKNKKQEYQKIVDDLIKKSFPELKKRKIKVVYAPMLKKYSGGALYPFSWIFLSKKTDSFSKILIKGLLAHELAHLEIFYLRNFFKNLFIGAGYHLKSKIRKIEEDNAIKLAVERGYAKEHYELTKLSEKLHGKSLHKYYMTAEEIKKYAIEINKWHQEGTRTLLGKHTKW